MKNKKLLPILGLVSGLMLSTSIFAAAVYNDLGYTMTEFTASAYPVAPHSDVHGIEQTGGVFGYDPRIAIGPQEDENFTVCTLPDGDMKGGNYVKITGSKSGDTVNVKCVVYNSAHAPIDTVTSQLVKGPEPTGWTLNGKTLYNVNDYIRGFYDSFK